MSFIGIGFVIIFLHRSRLFFFQVADARVEIGAGSGDDRSSTAEGKHQSNPAPRSNPLMEPTNVPASDPPSHINGSTRWSARGRIRMLARLANSAIWIRNSVGVVKLKKWWMIFRGCN